MAGTVTIDQRDMAELKLTINTIAGGSKLAIVRATNDSMAGVKTESVKLIGGKITAKATVIRAHFKVNKMSVQNLSADIECAGLPVPLASYSTNKVKKGVSVKIFKSSKRYVIEHAFKAQMKSGHIGVFWRYHKGRGVVWPVRQYKTLPPPTKDSALRKYQLPIEQLYGPRIPDIFDDNDIMQPVLANASKRFDERLEHHTTRLLQQAS
jgi:ribosomal protein S17E